MKVKIVNAAAALLLASAGCSMMRSGTQSTNTNSSNTSSNSTTQTATPQTATRNSPEAAATAAVKSIYTDLTGRGCGPERRTSEVSSERTCAGIEGYKLLVQNDDERDTITIITPDGQQHPLNLSEIIGKGAFDYVGQKAEWRVIQKNGKDVPIALIVRVEVPSNGSNKPGSYLAVSKIGERDICVTDRIDPIPNANEKAREAADASASKPCLSSS